MKIPPKNILLIDKPKGITSYDVIRRLKKKYPKQKIGHAGTLDPLATGLLVVGVGAGTKLLKDLIGLSKEYEAEILLGLSTTTGDMEGVIIEEKKVDMVGHTDLKNVLSGLTGKLSLRVPVYSAIKQRGEPLYKKARRGEKVETPVREMEIYKIDLLDVFRYKKYFVVKIGIKVKSGVYIRSVAEEIGNRLGVPATIKELRRTKVGEYSVENAENIE